MSLFIFCFALGFYIFLYELTTIRSPCGLSRGKTIEPFILVLPSTHTHACLHSPGPRRHRRRSECARSHLRPEEAVARGIYKYLYYNMYLLFSGGLRESHTQTHILAGPDLYDLSVIARGAYIHSHIGTYIYTLWTSRDNLVLIIPRVLGRTESGISMTSRTPIINIIQLCIIFYY